MTTYMLEADWDWRALMNGMEDSQIDIMIITGGVVQVGSGGCHHVSDICDDTKVIAETENCCASKSVGTIA